MAQHPLSFAARAYIERLGFSLVVQSPEKVPLASFFPHGATSATRSIGVVAKALRSCPGALLAARVGDHLVLDIDTRHDGHASLEKLLASFGELPETWTAETPTGGLHIWFRPTGFRTRGTLATGIEALYGNRCVTLAPSERAGGRYRWVKHPLSTPLAECPRWIAEGLRLPDPPKRTSQSDEDPAVREKRARAWIAKADGAITGASGHNRTMAVAVCIVRGFDIDPDVAFSVMQDWNGLCDPPWSDYDLKRKIREAYQHGRMEFGALLAKSREARAA